MNDATHTTRSTTTTVTETTTTVTETAHADSVHPATAREQTSARSHRALKMDDVRATTDWEYLTEFEISDPEQGDVPFPTVPVFANGRQQAHLRVVLSPRNKHGEFVDVPAAELLPRLKLVNHKGGGSLPDGWAFAGSRNDYTLANRPRSGRAERSPRARQAVEVDIYVTTTEANSREIAVAIESPSGQYFETRPPVGGEGNFDSAVIISGRERPKLPYANVPSGVEGIHVNGVTHSGSDGPIRASSWYISLSYGEDNVLIHSWDKGEVPCLWWDNGDWGPWEGFFTYVSDQPGSSTFSDKGLPAWLGESHTSNRYPTPRLHPKVGQIEVMMVGYQENAHFWWVHWEEAPQKFSSDTTFIDEFGNKFGLTMAFAQDDWDVLRAYVYPPRNGGV